MPRKLVPLAIAYDFDGTLVPGNMQEQGFIPKIRMSRKAFWSEVAQLAKHHEADNILVYMHLMLEKAREAKVPVHKSDFENFGKTLKLFIGVQDWFDRITKYGRAANVRVEHYVISSGIREMVLGSPIARKFEAVFASSYMYEHNGVAQWPALALNYTTKTQYLFRINKGSLHVYDHSKINEYVPKDRRPIPFENMIFIGDGETDIPCFRLVKDQGGHAIAVYRPHSGKAKKLSEQLIKDGRVHFALPADYRDKRDLDKVVKAIIDKMAADHDVRVLGKTRS
ncbi:MAG: haloacid dehalogenase-like hydrolase [Methylomonas sp.]|nr:haloacid dehalogenase-like hydrolase [Methylomonas sp.]